MSALPPVLSCLDLPAPELAAARLDGDVFLVSGERYACVDECDGPALRAASLAGVIPAPAIVEGRSAAWVYGVLSRPPRRHTLCLDAAHRARINPDTRWAVRERRLAAGDVAAQAGVRVVTPLCLACDLLRGTDFDTAERTVLQRLMRSYGVSVPAVHARLRRGRALPGAVQGLRRLALFGVAVRDRVMCDEPGVRRGAAGPGRRQFEETR